MNQYFLQSIEINGAILPRESVTSVAYIEIAKLEAPILLLNVRDMTGYVLDNMGVKEGAIIVATLGDPEGEKALFKETFYTVSAPLNMDTVTITAISMAMRTLLIPTGAPRFFVDAEPRKIISTLAQGLNQIVDPFNRIGTYHLNMGQKPATLIRQIAKDYGALAWIARGNINVKSMIDLIKTKPAFTYEYNNPNANYQYLITKMRNINSDFAVTASKQHRYVGYSMTDGYRSSGDASLPVRVVSDSELGILQNMGRVLIPKLDVECSGNPAIQAGTVIQVIIHRYDPDNRIDESVPKKMIVERVTQFEERIAYSTRMILGIPSE
ncbi:tail length tape measure protein [Xenorhabdus sp. XENO-10]|uniref:Tail length tape measure protein n=1 Tax=Xenorhabdus yunnanensis TaxID=3025878 RepID=A0ABT5LI02_9GAMM|nr:tail length tape measure protein [Xenorhabdus yunnanensis]MDC9590736.1 tail length tape measure protein [Xenorhabdus yunnanensis]